VAEVRKLNFPSLKSEHGDVYSYLLFFHKPKPDRYAFMTDGLLAKMGWVHQTGGGISRFPECARSRGDIRKEIDTLCKAFGEANRLIDAGSSYTATVEPVLAASRLICCDDVYEMFRALPHVHDGDKYTIWCALSAERAKTDAGEILQCGWAQCPAFLDFWPKLGKKPDSWFPPLEAN